jgi:hypothetical protein
MAEGENSAHSDEAKIDTMSQKKTAIGAFTEHDLANNLWLYEPDYEYVFEHQEPEYVLTRAAWLSTLAVYESTSAFNNMKQPKPGLPTGRVDEWEPGIQTNPYLPAPVSVR